MQETNESKEREKCAYKLMQTFKLTKGENILNFVQNREIKQQPSFSETNLKKE